MGSSLCNALFFSFLKWCIKQNPKTLTCHFVRISSLRCPNVKEHVYFFFVYSLPLLLRIANETFLHIHQGPNTYPLVSLKDGKNKYVVQANSKTYGVYFFEILREQNEND